MEPTDQLARAGHGRAMDAVIAALIRTHPDPVAFAAALRSTWQLAGEPHTDASTSASYMEAASAVLGVVESACPVPVGIRPGMPLPGDQLGRILQGGKSGHRNTGA